MQKCLLAELLEIKFKNANLAESINAIYRVNLSQKPMSEQTVEMYKAKLILNACLELTIIIYQYIASSKWQVF